MQPSAYSLGISVVVYTPYDHRWLELLLSALRAQTVCEQIELIVTCRSRKILAADVCDFSGFGRALVVETTDDHSYVGGKIAGLLAASAPIVAFAEDHALPEPEWAERLILAHRANWAAVCPSMTNCNPDSVTSRVGFALHWGPWTQSVIAGEANLLAAHNTSYKRSVLLELLGELRELLVVEHFLHTRLRELGYHLAVEPAAVVSHCNISKLSSWFRLCYSGGRLYGARRVVHERLSVGQRAARVVTLPLVPLVQLWRVSPHITNTTGSMRDFAAALPLAAISLTVHTIGEGMGYLFGEGRSEEACEDLETSRFRDMVASDLDDVRHRANGSRMPNQLIREE